MTGVSNEKQHQSSSKTRCKPISFGRLNRTKEETINMDTKLREVCQRFKRSCRSPHAPCDGSIATVYGHVQKSHLGNRRFWVAVSHPCPAPRPPREKQKSNTPTHGCGCGGHHWRARLCCTPLGLFLSSVSRLDPCDQQTPGVSVLPIGFWWYCCRLLLRQVLHSSECS